MYQVAQSKFTINTLPKRTSMTPLKTTKQYKTLITTVTTKKWYLINMQILSAKRCTTTTNKNKDKLNKDARW